MSLAAYAPEQTAPKQAEAAAQSAIEEQLALQHKQPAQLSQLERKGSNLLIDGDTILLEGLAPTTAVKRHDAGGVVLGFEIANGAVASYDFPVGKVLYISCHMTGHKTILRSCYMFAAELCRVCSLKFMVQYKAHTFHHCAWRKIFKLQSNAMQRYACAHQDWHVLMDSLFLPL